MTSLKRACDAYRLRWKRKRRLFGAFRRRRDLISVCDRTDGIDRDGVLLFSTMRNERDRLEHFLAHYRSLGVSQFLIVDNESTDGTRELLEKQADVSLWTTDKSYRQAHFGDDWLAWLRMKYGHDHWCLTVDADEILIYPNWESTGLTGLVAGLEAFGANAMGALMIDLYPKEPLNSQVLHLGTNPLELLRWFDAGPHRAQRQSPMDNLWVQGGVRDRVFFGDAPARAPTMNKLPLVKWHRRNAYVNSTHSVLPRRLNQAYDGPGDRRLSGVLLHTKFLPSIGRKAQEEKSRRQHFGNPDDFNDYYDRLIKGETLWHGGSVEFESWQQLVALGLMSEGK